MKKTIYLVQDDPFTTLTTWIYKAFWMMHKAEELGHIPYINWHSAGCLEVYRDAQKFSQIPNMYDWYFEQPFTTTPQPATGQDCVWKWEAPNGWGAGIVDDNILMNQPLKYLKDYFKKHLKFNDETNRRGQLLVDKYKIDFKNTIGITWRGTDNVTDGRPRLPIEAYYPFIDEILAKNPDMRIMCTAEEQGILEPLFARYPNAFNIEEFISVPNGTRVNPERVASVSGYEKGLQPALMVWLFSKCNSYIKNRSSTGAVASWLSDGNIICLGHEQTLSYNLAFDYVEKNGIKYTLDNKLIG